MKTVPAYPPAIQKFKELLNDVEVCMLLTTDSGGKTTSRPMVTLDVDRDGHIWFFTNELSDKVQDANKHAAVALIYARPSKNIYIHINGTCTIVRDKAKERELWVPPLTEWFPLGLDDPKLCLIRVIPDEAHYWESTLSKMVAFI
jgi:general stress protein 26